MTKEEDLHAILPWAHPFRMLDRMIECVPHERIVVLKRVTANDSILEGSDDEGVLFFPAVLVLEVLGQSAALLFRLSYGPGSLSGAPLLGHLTAKLHGAARPGDTIESTVTARKMTTRGGIFTGVARVEGSVIVEAELGFGVGAP